MSIRNLLIIVIIIVLLVLFYYNRANLRTYELKGKVTMINDCSSDINDLPDTIRIKGKLHYDRAIEPPSEFDNMNIPAVAINASTKEAEYSFEVTSSHIAEEWKIEYIKRNTGLEICDPIVCEGTPVPVCRDAGTITASAFTIPVPPGQTVVTKDFRFSCSCRQQ
jgi:hypothetical protein